MYKELVTINTTKYLRRYLSKETNVKVMSFVTYMLLAFFVSLDSAISFNPAHFWDWALGIAVYGFMFSGVKRFYEWVYGNYTITYSNE